MVDKGSIAETWILRNLLEELNKAKVQTTNFLLDSFHKYSKENSREVNENPNPNKHNNHIAPNTTLSKRTNVQTEVKLTLNDEEEGSEEGTSSGLIVTSPKTIPKKENKQTNKKKEKKEETRQEKNTTVLCKQESDTDDDDTMDMRGPDEMDTSYSNMRLDNNNVSSTYWGHAGDVLGQSCAMPV